MSRARGSWRSSTACERRKPRGTSRRRRLPKGSFEEAPREDAQDSSSNKSSNHCISEQDVRNEEADALLPQFAPNNVQSPVMEKRINPSNELDFQLDGSRKERLLSDNTGKTSQSAENPLQYIGKTGGTRRLSAMSGKRRLTN